VVVAAAVFLVVHPPFSPSAFENNVGPSTSALENPKISTTPVKATSSAHTSVTLSRKFIESLMDRATLDIAFEVDQVEGATNRPQNDNVCRASGRAPEVQLPTVIQVINAGLFPEAIEAVKAAEGREKPIAVQGAWRVWFSQAGTQNQTRGSPIPKRLASSNHDHVFELYPTTNIEKCSLLKFFKKLDGRQAKPADVAIPALENTPFRIPREQHEMVSISSRAPGFNYVEFVMEVGVDPTVMTRAAT
jgi:hypothetical protein